MSFWPFFIMQVVIFVGLIIALRRILGRNLLDATAHLEGLSVEYARRHDELKHKLQEAEREYQEQISRAKSECEQLTMQSKQDAESSKARLLAEARSESERIIQQALESSNGLKREFDEQVYRRAIEQACELIQQVLPGQLRQDMQAGWVDELIQDGLSQLDGLTMEEPVGEVKVVSAFPLTKAQRELLRQRLKEKLRRECPLTESTDERLVAGLTITLGSLVLDGSLASKIQGAARHAQDSV